MSEPAGFVLLAEALVDVVLDTLQQIEVQENIGLGNVDNTTDMNKPVSTAQSAAITAAVDAAVAALTIVDNLKAPLASPAFTGNPTVPTAALGDADTTIASTAFVRANGIYPTRISTAVSMDTLIEAGAYFTETAVTNGPVAATQYYVLVQRYPQGAGYVQQTAWDLTATGGVWTRNQAASVWTTWTRIADRTYVDTTVNALLEASNAEQYKGLIDCSINPDYPAANAGHTYRVSVAGKIGGASGPNVEVSDRLQCIVDGSAAGNHATVGANWWITQANIDGQVTGPVSVTSGNPAVFNGTTGKIIQEVTFTAFKTSLALNNVDNTSDANKPVSTAQATADGLRLLTSSVNANVLTWMGAPSSANLAAAVTDESGTGNIVFETSGTWTPSDQSGAGLTFTGVNCRYTRQGNRVWCYGVLTFPSTANGNNILIGGLPFTVANTGYAGVPSFVKNSAGIAGTNTQVVANTTNFGMFKQGGGTPVTNAEVTLNTLTFNMVYPLA